MVFGKKKDKEEAKGKSDVPVQAVMSMKQRGMGNEQVIEQLKSQGYSLQAIRDALTQANVKQGAVGPAPAPPMPGDMPGLDEGPELPPMPGQAPEPGPEMTPARGGPGLNVPTSFAAPTTKDAGIKVEEMERILEEIVDERWKDVTAKFSELEASKTENDVRINELSKRVSELSSRIDEISSVVMGKVDEYKKTMEDVDVEIKALEKVMQKLVPSMAEQVKELKGVIGGLKGKSIE
jgi:DNA-binding transcriptional MerR regulator